MDYARLYPSIGAIPRGAIADWWIHKYYWYGKRVDKYYYPSNPRTGKQQGWRSAMYDGVQNWHGFDAIAKNFYNRMKYPANMPGISRYLRLYLRQVEPMIIYWDSLEKNAGDPALIPDYIASPYFSAGFYPAAAKKLLALGPSGELSLPSNLWILGQLGIVGALNDLEGLKFQIDYSNQNTSARLFFAEAGENNYGISLIYAGAANPTFGGVTFTLATNTFYLIRHNASTTGNIVLSIPRESSKVSFEGDIGVADAKSIIFTSGAKVLRNAGDLKLYPESGKVVADQFDIPFSTYRYLRTVTKSMSIEITSTSGDSPTEATTVATTFTALANKIYKVTAIIHVQNDAAPNIRYAMLALYDTDTKLAGFFTNTLMDSGAGSEYYEFVLSWVGTLTAGEHTIKVKGWKVSGGGTCNFFADTNMESNLLVEEFEGAALS